MATTIQQEFLTQLRRRETDVLKIAPSWEQILARERVVPSYTYEFNKIHEDLIVEVTPNGIPGRRGNITRTRSKANMYFFMSLIDKPWVENWFMENHGGALPTPIQPLSNQEISRLVREVRLKMDEFFWDGSTKWVEDGMMDFDGAPTAAASNLSASAGPKDFVKAVIASTKRAEVDLAQGTRILAIDSKELPELIRPWDDATGQGPSIISMLREAVSLIVGVQASAIDKQALLHTRNMDIAAWLNSIPNAGGVQIRKSDIEGNESWKVFHHAGLGYFRDGEGTDGGLGFYEISNLAP